MRPPRESGPNENPGLQYLQDVRDSLLILHKALIESERIGYEETFGTLESKNRFLQLLINDPWFAWLHPLSELIVVMDEALEAEEPVSAAYMQELIDHVRLLLIASEEGHGFPRSYFEALQRDPDVVLAHAEVMKRLKRKSD